MTLEAAKQAISISSEAARAVQDIINEKDMEGHALRIYVSGSGCSGVQFGMALDKNISDTDTTVETDGVKIVVDHQSLDYVYGASVDFVNDPQKGSGFVISNPNAVSDCGGCGTQENEGSDSCGGGDSDGCGCGH